MEVEQLIKTEAKETARKENTLEADLAKVDLTINRLLNILESEVSSDAIVLRLQAKEAEARRLRVAIAERDMVDAKATMVPTLPDLEEVYEAIVRRLDTLLSGRNHVVHANELIHELISDIRVRPDEDARDGLAVTIHGDLARIVTAGDTKYEGAPEGALSSLGQISVVAGVGFEPTTFRL